MWAKLGAKIIYELVFQLIALIPKAIQLVTDYLNRKKRIKETQDVARRIENENNSDVIRNSADDLP